VYLQDLKGAKVDEYNTFIKSSSKLEETLAQSDDLSSYLTEMLHKFLAAQKESNATESCTKVHSFSFVDHALW
jgi:hypothetical protein